MLQQLYSLLILHVTTELHSINYKWQIISYSCTFEDVAAGVTAILRERNRMSVNNPAIHEQPSDPAELVL